MRRAAATWAAVALAALSSAGCLAPPKHDVSEFAWIEGCWRGERLAERWTREGDALVGVGERLGANGWTLSERMRIARDDAGLALFATPASAPAPTRFALTMLGASEATFEYPEHDDPKAIRYRREGDRLKAWAGDLPGLSPAFDGARGPCP